jgi:hypothetical protein
MKATKNRFMKKSMGTMLGIEHLGKVHTARRRIHEEKGVRRHGTVGRLQGRYWPIS